MAESVPSTNSDAFKDSYSEYITLRVLGKYIDDYKVKEPWSKFMEILALDGTAKAADLNNDSKVDDTDISILVRMIMGK